jgi:hypothetical protein
MFKILATATVVAILVASSPVAALDSPTPEQPVQPAQPAPSAGDSETRSTINGNAVANQNAPTFVDQQADNSVLASQALGATVYDAADQSLGTVSDFVLAEDGSIDAIVIGVGGFLGIGGKDVAVTLAAFDGTVGPNGNVKLMLDVTAKELENAPAFTTLAELRRQQETNTQPPAGPAGTAPAPAPAM